MIKTWHIQALAILIGTIIVWTIIERATDKFLDREDLF